jgi:predicted methyltransferase
MIRRNLLALSVFVVLAACSGSQASAPDPVDPTTPVVDPGAKPDPIAAAVANTERPEEDRVRDPDRRPGDVLAFFGIAPGMKVVDLAAGAGYYTELLARVVGPTGSVLAQNNAFVLGFAEKPLTERLARPGLENIERLDSEFDDLQLPGELDAVLMVLFYHDTYWMKTDRAKMNAEVLAALKPGGIFGIVDHHAAAGSGERDVKSLHRVDAAIVKQELLAAGFELAGESQVLRHAEDDRTKNVFDDALRGKTDRFVYKFRKPAP